MGDGTTTNRTTPVQITSLSGVIAIAQGGAHSLTVKTDGTVWAWGYNYYGQLGNGTSGDGADRTTPVQVSGLTGVATIAGGGYHSLALKTDGTVWAWGHNWFGQLGDGTMTYCTKTPVQVVGLTDVVAIAGSGYHSLALKSDGTVWAWGYNGYGQLGDGTLTLRTTPVQVSGLTDVVAVAGGVFHSLALKSDGTAWSWGSNNYGQLGDDTTIDRCTPVQVYKLTGIVAVAAGSYHSLFLGPPLPPTILNAISRKTHGSAGACDLDVRSAPATEPRKNGPTSLLVVFDRDIQGLDGLDNNDVYLSSGTITGLSIDFGRQLTINLTGSTNGQPLTVAFPGIVAVDDPTLTVTDALCIGVLAGNVDGSDTVDILDLAAIRNHLGQPVNASTFRYDVTADGLLNAFDLTFTRARFNSTLAVP